MAIFGSHSNLSNLPNSIIGKEKKSPELKSRLNEPVNQANKTKPPKHRIEESPYYTNNVITTPTLHNTINATNARSSPTSKARDKSQTRAPPTRDASKPTTSSSRKLHNFK